jgi:hypothetical protein
LLGFASPALANSNQTNPIDESSLGTPVCLVRPPRNQGGEPSIRVLFYGGDLANRFCAGDDPGGLGWIKTTPADGDASDNPPDAVCYFLMYGDLVVTVHSADSGASSAQDICRNALPNTLGQPPYWYPPYTD